MHRTLRSEDIGVEGLINRFRGMLHIENNVAVFQIEHLEKATGSTLSFPSILRAMRRLATNHGASKIRIEAAIANTKLNSVLVRKFGPPEPGDNPRFLDTWTFEV